MDRLLKLFALLVVGFLLGTLFGIVLGREDGYDQGLRDGA